MSVDATVNFIDSDVIYEAHLRKVAFKEVLKERRLVQVNVEELKKKQVRQWKSEIPSSQRRLREHLSHGRWSTSTLNSCVDVPGLTAVAAGRIPLRSTRQRQRQIEAELAPKAQASAAGKPSRQVSYEAHKTAKQRLPQNSFERYVFQEVTKWQPLYSMSRFRILTKQSLHEKVLRDRREADERKRKLMELTQQALEDATAQVTGRAPIDRGSALAKVLPKRKTPPEFALGNGELSSRGPSSVGEPQKLQKSPQESERARGCNSKRNGFFVSSRKRSVARGTDNRIPALNEPPKVDIDMVVTATDNWFEQVASSQLANGAASAKFPRLLEKLARPLRPRGWKRWWQRCREKREKSRERKRRWLKKFGAQAPTKKWSPPTNNVDTASGIDAAANTAAAVLVSKAIGANVEKRTAIMTISGDKGISECVSDGTVDPSRPLPPAGTALAAGAFSSSLDKLPAAPPRSVVPTKQAQKSTEEDRIAKRAVRKVTRNVDRHFRIMAERMAAKQQRKEAKKKVQTLAAAIGAANDSSASVAFPPTKKARTNTSGSCKMCSETHASGPSATLGAEITTSRTGKRCLSEQVGRAPAQKNDKKRRIAVSASFAPNNENAQLKNDGRPATDSPTTALLKELAASVIDSTPEQPRCTTGDNSPTHVNLAAAVEQSLPPSISRNSTRVPSPRTFLGGTAPAVTKNPSPTSIPSVELLQESPPVSSLVATLTSDGDENDGLTLFAGESPLCTVKVNCAL